MRVSAILVEEPPVWEFRGGHFFRTCQQSGATEAFPPNVFFKTFAGMAAVAREYRCDGADIIQFPATG